MKSISTLFILYVALLALCVLAIERDVGFGGRHIVHTIPKPPKKGGGGGGGGRKRSIPHRLLYDDNYGLHIPVKERSSPSIVEPTAGCTKCQSSLRFSTKASEEYAVGTDIPTLGLKTKNSWAGLMPVTPNKSDFFFFWMWANDGNKPSDEVVIWLNGGPGCSSLYGMTAEVGPFLYPSKKEKPYVNQYAWTKEAIMVFVELPVGVGFTTGSTKVTDEEELAQQFATFLDNFFVTFPELKGKKLYIAGESYAAFYTTYIMNHLYDLGNKVNLQGGMFVSGLVSSRAAQGDLVAYDVAVRYKDALKLTTDDLAFIKSHAEECGYIGYLEKNLVYPPRGRLPPFNLDGCSTLAGGLFNRTFAKNPKFNVYRFSIDDPLPDSPLGNPFADKPDTTFFDNAEVQKYIHASSQKWNLCNADKVFVGGDRSKAPDQSPDYSHPLLAKAIERSPAGLMMLSGREDLVILTDGTSLVLQNLTWHNAQGFQAKPSQPLLDSKGKAVGVWTQERGLTYATFDHSGHSIPTDVPDAAFTAFQVMLGRKSFPKK